MQTIEAWGKNILIIQSAIRNESTNPIFIPVEFADMSIHAKTLEYRMKILRDGDDPFADTIGHPIRYLGANLVARHDPFITPHVTPAYLARLESGEMVTFSPVTADLGDGPTISSLSVTFHLKISVPLDRPPIFQVNRSPKKRFQEEYLKAFDFQMIPTGEWRVEVSLEAAGKPAEQGAPVQPPPAPTQK